MKNIFLAAPFKNLIDKDTSLLIKECMNQLMSLISLLESLGYSVHNAHKREKWGKEFMSPDECTKIDYDEISKCDIFIAFPGNPPSPGTHIEIGWASAMNKKIFILIEEKEEHYAYLVRGLHTVADVTYITYQNENEYIEMLKKYL